eukprot:COSAG06_NODE_10562_length_1658_cov_2.427197_1_plen_114_part_10
MRWKKVLPAAIAECQHGFIYRRRQFENVIKVRDACELADMVADARHYLLHPEDIPHGHDPALLLSADEINDMVDAIGYGGMASSTAASPTHPLTQQSEAWRSTSSGRSGLPASP